MCVACGCVNKAVYISLVRQYNVSEILSVISVRISVSVPQCFRHVGTCVQLLSPLIFLSGGICTVHSETAHPTLRGR